ncbi:MAG TPA: hypothetical protein VM938_04530 [Acidimicrobiales bacterium]|nr:hypothetical protein [Acidimicrobiales bacterium]
MTPADDGGRFVWTVTWGRPGRADWKALHVLAYDADEAVVLASAARPEWLRPQEVFLAAEATARAVLDPEAAADVPVTLPVVRS